MLKLLQSTLLLILILGCATRHNSKVKRTIATQQDSDSSKALHYLTCKNDKGATIYAKYLPMYRSTAKIDMKIQEPIDTVSIHHDFTKTPLSATFLPPFDITDYPKIKRYCKIWPIAVKTQGDSRVFTQSDSFSNLNEKEKSELEADLQLISKFSNADFSNQSERLVDHYRQPNIQRLMYPELLK